MRPLLKVVKGNGVRKEGAWSLLEAHETSSAVSGFVDGARTMHWRSLYRCQKKIIVQKRTVDQQACRFGIVISDGKGARLIPRLEPF